VIDEDVVAALAFAGAELGQVLSGPGLVEGAVAGPVGGGHDDDAEARLILRKAHQVVCALSTLVDHDVQTRVGQVCWGKGQDPGDNPIQCRHNVGPGDGWESKDHQVVDRAPVGRGVEPPDGLDTDQSGEGDGQVNGPNDGHVVVYGGGRTHRVEEPREDSEADEDHREYGQARPEVVARRVVKAEICDTVRGDVRGVSR
jgi:hypothetical protein